MSDQQGSHESPTRALQRRVDDMQTQIDAMRGEIDALDLAARAKAESIGRLDARVAAVEGKIDQVAQHQGRQDVLLNRLVSKVGRGTVIGAGVPTLTYIVLEVAKAFGLMH